ncbi:uncharacterized protein [Euwallacea fornicatus]|uniref:uncharacterized protein n=1 Tax=Euwallacea fornicatus TaxID=995702 RepID=UPI00338DAFD9
MMSTNESDLDLPQAVSSPSQRTLGRFSDYKEGYVIEPVRTNCNRCLSCVEMMNISEYYSHEVTPLLASSRHVLRTSQCYDKTLVVFFVLMLLFGAGIGTYLLMIETEGTIIEEFDFVSREKWGVNETLLKDLPALRTPVSKLFLQELTPNCANKHCLQYSEYRENHKEKLKILDGGVKYNFYQDRSGRIFEGRGANFQSECGQQEGCDDVLTMGMIGERGAAPSHRQTVRLKAFLDYAVGSEVLQPCYVVLVSHSAERYFDDLATALAARNRRDSACVYFY